MKKHVFYWMALALLVIVGCQKETSFELGNTPGQGSLQSDVSGDCLPKSVNGIYEAEKALVPATNTITVTVNVTRTGVYDIRTDTVNGYYFRGTGTFTTIGPTVITLRGNGTPFVDGTDNFVVSFDGSICDIAVDVLPAGASSPAVFTLAGAPGACTGAVVNGTYATGTALTATNTVTINVNVTTIGIYNVTTTFQGMTFAKSGVFTTTGPATITLNGTGTPTTAGANTVPFTVGSTTCSFVVNVLSPVTGTLGGGPGACTPATVNGTYGQGVALTAANTVDVQITTASVGAYTVTTNTVAGFSFSGTGTSTGATQTITLTGTGTPTAAGTQTFTVTFGTSTCTFTVPVAGPAVYTIDCPNVIVNGTYTGGVALNASNTIDVPVTVTSAGPYTITASINGMTFSGSGTLPVGTTTITLNGTGTPTTGSVTSNLTLPGGCSVPITVGAALVITWTLNDGVTTYQGVTTDAALDPLGGGLNELYYEGDNPTGDLFAFDAVDIAGGVNNGDQYKANATTAPPENFLFDFHFENAANTVTYDANGTNGTNMKVIVTTHNTATKTFNGTFSGTVIDIAGATKTISGTFKGTYP